MTKTILLLTSCLFLDPVFAETKIISKSLPNFETAKTEINNIVDVNASISSLKKQKEKLLTITSNLTDLHLYRTGETLKQPYVVRVNFGAESYRDDIKGLIKWINMTLDNSKGRFDNADPISASLYITDIKLINEFEEISCQSDNNLTVISSESVNYFTATCKNSDGKELAIAARVGITKSYKLIFNNQTLGTFDPLDDDSFILYSSSEKYGNTLASMKIKSKLK